MHLYDAMDPVELTGVARGLIAAEDREENRPILGRWFPNTETDDIEFGFDTGTDRTYTDAMPFRTWNVGAAIGRRPGRARVTGEIPPLSLKFALSEYDRIKARAAEGTPIGDLLEETVTKDIERGITALESRMAAAMASSIINGQLVFTERGMSVTVAYGRNAGNSTTVANAWSDATNGTPITDEITFLEWIADNEGFGPGDLVMLANRTTINDLTLSDEYRNSAATLRVQSRLSSAQLSESRRAHELPPILEYNAKFADSSGTVAKQIPDGKVAYLPASVALGETVYGIPAIVGEGVNLERNNRPGPVAYLGRDIDPVTVWTVIEAVGLPVMKDPNATFVIDVT